MKYILPLIIILLLISAQLTAQVYPVSVSAQSVPPHTGNIADWTAVGTNRLTVLVLLQDANEVNFQARVKLRIQGQGITLRSRNDILPSPISLRYGAPTQLNGPDLATLLHYENLNFENYSLQQYEANGGLPDGNYQVCFEVYDYDRADEKPASAETCVTIFASLHAPPVLLAPIGELQPLYPQFVPVQWQARHNGGFPTQYLVEIYEYDPDGGLTPELILDFEQPVIRKTILSMNSAIVDASDPQLTQGSQYLIRVQAKDLTQRNGFKNKGWSDFEIFTYGSDNCPEPLNIRTPNVDETAATITWSPPAGVRPTSYVLRYRNKDRAKAKWYEDEVFGARHRLKYLAEATTYEYQLYSMCEGNRAGVYSIVDTFTTEAAPLPIDCGDPATFPVITNQRRIDSLTADMTISIFNFKVVLDSVVLNGDRWEGKGRLKIPWIGTYVNVLFENISVNTDRVVFDGEINAVSDGLESLPGFISAADLAAARAAPELEVCSPDLADPSNTKGRETSTASNESNDSNGNDGEAAGNDETTSFNNSDNTFDWEASDTIIVASQEELLSINLPFGLASNPDSGQVYTIALNEMVFKPQSATLKAYIALDVPMGSGNVQHMVFSGENNFHSYGLIGESKLMLEADVQAQLMPNSRFTFVGGNNSYVSWDCDGFRSVSVEGVVDFCSEVIIPIDPATGVADTSGTGYVTGSFVATMPEWGEFVANISVSPFALAQRPDWKWEVQNMIYDNSELFTPDVVRFPENYKHADVNGQASEDNYPRWKGFFIKQAKVTLPNSLTGVEEGDEVTVGGEHVIYDNTGFSAWVYGTDLLPLEKGRMGTWAFSIDSLGIEIQSNNFENLAFAGEVDVPAFKKEFAYEAFIDPADEYFFKVIWQDTLTLDAFKAKVELHASSSIELRYHQKDKKFQSEAVLHGMASFQPQTSGGTGLQIPYLKFENLKLMTNDPYVELGSWALVGDVSANFGNFAITLCGFGITKDEQTKEVIIGFCAKVHLTGASGGELAADGFFRIIADIKYSEALRRQVWAFKDFKVDKLGIDASGTGYAFKGDIEFYEKHPVYGKGFRGAVEATFEPKLTVGAVAQFGSVDGYKYFFADALASYNPGLAIGTSGLMLYGFGGGVSYHMARSGFEKIVMPQEGNNPVPPTGLGVSLSGMKYVPKKQVGLGVKATVAIGTVNRTLFNGIATLEFIFNKSGGLHQIGFDGTGKFLTQPASDPQLSCNLLMTYDFPAKSFHATLDMFVNVQNQITGKYANNYAGQGVLHIDPNDWYIYIGTPDAPIALSLNTELIPKLDPVDISFGGYFDAGTKLPPFPGLPSEVSRAIGEYKITRRDDPRFDSGKALLFGANIKAELANLNYAVFYATLKAGAGWDMMLRDYGQFARCSHKATASSPIGIDGWYGTGQMYAYLTGEVGVRVDLKFVKGNYKILSIGAAAALQARLPNPMYMRGKVGGYFSILGGLVSGNCSFQFEAGEQCTVVGQDVLGLDLIADLSPNNNENKEVDVFIRPQVTFNFEMNREFIVYNEENEMGMYKAQLDQFSLVHKKTGEKVAGQIYWSADRFVMGFKTAEILQPKTEYQLYVSVKVMTQSQETGIWTVLEDTFGDPYFQFKEVNFTTGEAPNYVPLENIAYSYPVHTQFNYHTDESSEGYIQLVQGQDYLFNQANNQWVNKLRLIQNGQILKQCNFDYNPSNNRITFQLPPNDLANGTITQLALMAIPKTSDAALDANVRMTATNLLYNQTGDNSINAAPGEDFTSILLKQRSLENQAQNLSEVVMLAINFRTSQYATLREKIESMSSEKSYQGFVLLSGSRTTTGGAKGLFMDEFGLEWTGSELFDRFELEGFTNGEGQTIKPLIEMEALLTTTGRKNNKEWYDDVVFRRMISKFSNNVLPKTNRDPKIYGRIPTKAILLNQRKPFHNKVLTEREVQKNQAVFNADKARVTYRFPLVLYRDYAVLKQRLANRATRQRISREKLEFLRWQFEGPFRGDYKIMLRYRTPKAKAKDSLERVIRY